ncbi:hypothetical protein EMGBD4_16960 [Verrucomicrobiota bacterium]|nr:hypothetical protein EMGBD4_16960 [Verrucomicrobiota bacterium]
MGPIPHHMHQNAKQAKLLGLEGKPESYYFPPQHNNVGNNFPYTFMGFEPGTTKAQVRECIANWHKGDNKILALSKAYKLEAGTGWLIDPCILHAPGSLCTYEPQWGLRRLRYVSEPCRRPRSTVGSPRQGHAEVQAPRRRLHRRPARLGQERRPNFKDNHYLEPIVSVQGKGFVDKWIVYGKVDKFQYFTAKELTVEPGAECTITDKGAYGLICVQGSGTINGQVLNSPKLIRFHELTEDEYFCTADGATRGVTFRNTSTTEPLVCLRYFGPEVNPDAPAMGAYKKAKTK